MKLSDVYLSAYCDGDRLSNEEVLEAMPVFKLASDVMSGPIFVFNIQWIK